MTPTRTWSRHRPEKDPKPTLPGWVACCRGSVLEELRFLGTATLPYARSRGLRARAIYSRFFVKFRPYYILYIMRLSTSRKGRTSCRLKNWNYAWNASYFVTLCTAQRHCYFGRIEGEKMCFSPEGAVADALWHEIKNHAKNVELGSYVIIPNHVHGIITLNDNKHSAVGTRHLSMLPWRHLVPTK